MNDLTSFGLALCVAYLGTAGAGRWLTGRHSYAVAGLCTIGLIGCPLFVPARAVILRALCVFFCTELFFKVFDYARQHRLLELKDVRLRDFCLFLIPFPPLAIVFGSVGAVAEGARVRQAMIRIPIGILGTAVGLAGFHLAAGSTTFRENFLIDHVAKALLFVITIESLTAAIVGLEILAGLSAPKPMHFMFLARTVAEFWWRYNARVNRWLYLNVFEPAGGRRSVWKGVVWTFFVSAVLHECMFAVATSRIDGYQFAFFMVQAPAVLVSRRIDRFANSGGPMWKLAAHLSTMIWLLVTSTLFFHGFDRVFPFFYASEPWLP